MTYEIRANMNLNENEIQKFVVENQASTPSTTKKGRMVYLTADNKLYFYNGTAWIAITTSESGEYQLVSEKDQPEGYAGLDASGKIVIGELPTGIGVDTIPLLKGTLENGQGIKYDQASGGFIPFDVSTLYTFKGSCTSAELDTKTATAHSGDVWNVTDTRAWKTGTYPAGTNWAFESTGAGTGNWEPLTGIMDLSGYQTTANLVQTLAGADTTHYPSAKTVSDAIGVVSAVASAAVVANSPITAGTACKITYDAKGLVTGGAALEPSDIPDIGATYLKVAQKGAASGVASLDENTKVPIAQLPTGNGENLIPVLPSTGAAGQAIVVNEDGDGFAFRTVPDHSLSRVIKTITGDGSTASWDFATSFGEAASAVTIRNASGNIIYADVTITATQVTVAMTPAPTADETFTVSIIG